MGDAGGEAGARAGQSGAIDACRGGGRWRGHRASASCAAEGASGAGGRAAAEYGAASRSSGARRTGATYRRGGAAGYRYGNHPQLTSTSGRERHMPHIRLARVGDAAQITTIYAPVVASSAISFELEPPTEGDHRRAHRALASSIPVAGQ